MKFIMSRNRTVATTKGHSIEFLKGVPTHVPYECREEVMAAGGVPETDVDEDPTPKPDTPAGEDREAIILAAIEAIVLRNNPKEFTAGGAPHIKTLERELGFDVDVHERDDLWDKFRQGAE